MSAYCISAHLAILSSYELAKGPVTKKSCLRVCCFLRRFKVRISVLRREGRGGGQQKSAYLIANEESTIRR